MDGSGRGAATSAQLRDQTTLDLQGVRYTVCPPGNNDWQLRADRISLDQKSSTGTGRNVRLDFLGVPILYTPWISFPVGDTRKSGLLFPAIGSGGKTGTQIVVPWYWNIAPNYDATFTSRYFSSRGYRIDPEFRYLTERSRGTLEAEYLPYDSERKDARGLFEFRDTTLFEPRTRALVDAAYVSDNSYFEDFGVGFEGTSITFLNQLGELRRDTTHWSLVGRVQNYQVIDGGLADDERPYSLLPQVVAAGRWNDLPLGLGATFDLEATNFDRDLGPQGIRVDTEPALSLACRATRGVRGRQCGVALHDVLTRRHGAGRGREPVALAADHEPRHRPRARADDGIDAAATADARAAPAVPLHPVPRPGRAAGVRHGSPNLNLVQLFRTNRYVGADRVGDANQVSVGLTSRLLDAAAAASS